MIQNRYSERTRGGLALLIVVVAATMTPLTAHARNEEPARGLLGLERADSALTNMVATERAFSALSVERGMREAFLHFLADDGVVFQPLAVNGKEAWRARAASPATLIWEPSHGEMASAGDLGWSSGPWEYRPPSDSTGAPPPANRIAHGHFISVWARQPDEQWRVVLDMGISHPPPERGLGNIEFKPKPAHTWMAGQNNPKSRANLAEIDRRYARDAKKLGAAALDVWATTDVRLNREGEYPTEGRDSAKTALLTAAAIVRLLPHGSRVSMSDDLGYTYGILERASSRGAAPDSSTYLHIWRREADRNWRIAVIVENPLPPR